MYQCYLKISQSLLGLGLGARCEVCEVLYTSDTVDQLLQGGTTKFEEN